MDINEAACFNKYMNELGVSWCQIQNQELRELGQTTQLLGLLFALGGGVG